MFFATIRARLTEELLARRADRWITGAIAVLLVALGFILGRWSSLTTSATPIVFQEAPGGGSSAAKPEDLRALVTGETATADAGTTGEAGITAGASTENTGASSGDSLGTFLASVNGTKYYHPSCPEVRRIKEENKIWFDTEEEAKESGYEPSACVQGR